MKKGVIIPALQRGHMTFRDDLIPCHPGNRWGNQHRGFSVGLNLYSQYQDTLAGKVSMGLVIVSKNDIRSISLTLHKSIQNRSKPWITDIRKPLKGNFRKTLQDGAICKKCPNRTPTAEEIPHLQINKYDYKTSQQKKYIYDHQSEQTAYRVGEKSLVATSVQGSVYKELQTLTPREQNCQPVSESTK